MSRDDRVFFVLPPLGALLVSASPQVGDGGVCGVAVCTWRPHKHHSGQCGRLINLTADRGRGADNNLSTR